MRGIRIRDFIRTRLSRKTSTTFYVPEIDGLRCVAVSLVLWCHVGCYLEHQCPGRFAVAPKSEPIWQTIERGKYGVELFFVLSGFVLALPFAAYHARGARRVDLSSYYLRRITRLEPPYILALTAYFLVRAATGDPGEGLAPGFPHYITSILYIHKIIYGILSPILTVAWSLEIEVQFYILAPLLALIYNVRNTRARRSIIILIISLSILINYIHLHNYWEPSFKFINYPQYFLAGFLLADLYIEGWMAPSERPWLWDAVSLVGWPLVVVGWLPERETFAVLPVLILLLYCAAFRGRAFKALFSNRWMTTIGGMCYSIYLLHPMILAVTMRLMKHLVITNRYPVNFLVKFSLTAPVVLALSAAYFALIERPCMERDWPRRLWKRLRPLLPSERGPRVCRQSIVACEDNQATRP